MSRKTLRGHQIHRERTLQARLRNDKADRVSLDSPRYRITNSNEEQEPVTYTYIDIWASPLSQPRPSITQPEPKEEKLRVVKSGKRRVRVA